MLVATDPMPVVSAFLPGTEPSMSAPQIRLSEILAALSYALDITEGQPEGHAARSCAIGMRLAQEVWASKRSVS
ncbi:MAG: hypothetical protein OHK0050_14010 [Roseiflexaceae bacterium]